MKNKTLLLLSLIFAALVGLFLLQTYLPAQMSAEEIEATVKKVVDHEKSQGDIVASDFGKVMKIVTAELKGKADGKTVGEIVKKLLQN